ncbi:MAG: monovalent cation/H+ antiporter complex subunit F [Lachnospiraceae bacterium]
MLSEAYHTLYSIALVFMGCLLALALVRTIIGPRVTDRILGVNMLGSLVIAMIAILSQMLRESYLLDVALIYTMISFVTVLVLSSVYLRKRKGRKDD